MIHGPCGPDFPQAPCMEGSNCSKHYLKPFCDETHIEENGFVKYRWRDYGRRITINGKELDNHWVVPYKRDLCVKYNAHINVKRCAQKKFLKYLHITLVCSWDGLKLIKLTLKQMFIHMLNSPTIMFGIEEPKNGQMAKTGMSWLTSFRTSQLQGGILPENVTNHCSCCKVFWRLENTWWHKIC